MNSDCWTSVVRNMYSAIIPIPGASPSALAICCAVGVSRCLRLAALTTCSEIGIPSSAAACQKGS
jgi:hypothetical protein